MIASAAGLFLTMSVAAASDVATERFLRLEQSSLLDKMIDAGWLIEREGLRLRYLPPADAGISNAQIEVLPQKAPFPSDAAWLDAYLTQRKTYCADLVRETAGRCLGTRRFRHRGGQIRGFRSRQIVQGTESVEILFPYQDADVSIGQEVIRGVLVLRQETPESLKVADEFILEHMTRLTLYY